MTRTGAVFALLIMFGAVIIVHLLDHHPDAFILAAFFGLMIWGLSEEDEDDEEEEDEEEEQENQYDVPVRRNRRASRSATYNRKRHRYARLPLTLPSAPSAKGQAT